ncbi:Zinc finger protein 398 [Dissostichus eleginoides]|uniref:Zinc finger protein 398 n=1 Tax=Dissostichus eleginoides TaxID=100907 RepID=A0AAD9FBH6_DISEL|nr:Zinc finger protein 398 [Dissostichus eleginoides]
MQSPTQSPSGPNPGATATQEPPLDTETEAQPAQSDSDEQKEKDEPAAPVMTETVTPQENGTEVQTAETPESLPVTQAVENEPAVQPQTEPSVNSAGVETDSASKPSAPSELVPDTNAKSKCDEKKAKKTDKGVREPRKYIPSKKAMVDPLKMDMSKQPVIPLTSSQLSLQCFECHIIFSDVKSKERHLKLSHPAEYEQCILRNSLFACYVCDRHFTNSIDLMLHQKAHTEKKPFKCPICSEAFNKSSELTFHKKNHYGQDGYECTDCGKNCKTMTALKYHMRKHSGERPYVCKECGKRFSMSKALQKHMMAQCQGQGGDPTADALKKAIGPSSIKYPCSLCKATFKSTRTRQHHMKTKHNMVPATANTLTHTSGAEVVDSQMQTVSLDQEHPVMDGAAPQETQEKAEQDQSEQEPSEKLPVEGKNGEESEVEDPAAKEVFPSNLETKQVPQVSELPASRQTPETLPAKPKTTRKRKACSGVETEGKHKAMVHIVESPGLTYTNGNIFEGVSTLDLYQLPKQPNKVVGVMNAAADWDTEPEITKSSEFGEPLASDENKQEEACLRNPSTESEVQALIQKYMMTQPSIKTLQPEISTEFEANKATAPAASLSTIASTLEKPPEEPVVLDPATSTDQVKGVRRLQGGEEHNRDANQSPVIILEKFLTSRQEATADKEPGLVTERNHQRQGFDNIAENEDLESQQIKVEENIPDRPLVAPICQNRLSASVTLQHHRDIRTVLVKEESSLVLNETQVSGRHIRWNVEPVNTENTSSPLIESEETAMDESCVTPPEFNTNQCIFYPVKEEEREFLLGAQTNSGNSTTGAFCDAQQTEQHVTDNSNEGCHSAPGYEEMRVRKLSEPGVSDSADKQAEAEAEMQHPPDLRDFLLQSSDEEDVGVFEMSDPQLDSEAEVMAYFYKNQTNSAQQAGSDDLSQNMPTTSGQIQAPREGTRTTEPMTTSPSILVGIPG